MNEEESARIALGEPDEDSLARERARARLRTRFGGSAPRRTPRRRPVSVVSVVALIVGSLVLLTTLPGRDSAASALNRLRGLAIRLPTAQLGQGESLHLRVETMGPEAQTVVGSYESFTRIVHIRENVWLQPDGSGVSQKEYLEATFASPADRANWAQLGSPSLPQAGETVTDRFSPPDSPVFDLSSVSTDPATLLAQLRQGPPGDPPLSDDQVFQRIGEILALGRTTPEQRVAIFSVARGLEGVTLIGDVSDPLGRPGIGLAVPGTSTTTMLVFDRETAELLAAEAFSSAADPSLGTPTEWEAFQPVEVVPNEAARQSG